MIDGLKSLGLAVDHDVKTRVARVTGCGGVIPATQADLFVANSGTTIRFLSAMVSAGRGNFRLHGIERMHSRPIGDLIEASNTSGSLRLGGVTPRLSAGSHCDCRSSRRGGRGPRRRVQSVPEWIADGESLCSRTACGSWLRASWFRGRTSR